MAYRCLFMDNDVYTAQDVNDAISNITSGGICGYPLGNGAMTDLNAAIAELANGGVNYKGTDCLVVNNGGTYKVSAGACIMNDGTQIIFDSDGYEITHAPGEYEYVYLERDVLHNRINVVVSEEAGGEDTIPLAEIKENGTIIDRRSFATAKISLAAEPKNISITTRLQFTVAWHGNYSYDLGFNGWKYIIIKTRRPDPFNEDAGKVFLELNDNETTFFFPYNNIAATGSSVYNYDTDVGVTRRGSVLEFQNSGNDTAYDVEIEVR
jgi:hypothetical protein